MTVTEKQNGGNVAQHPLAAGERSGNGNAGRPRVVHEKPGWFERFARGVAVLTGHPAAFFAACALVVVWLLTGPVFGFSDTWQLVINTGTTIVTFLMVFLIQQSQNRDTLALQVKLAELIIAVKKADNVIATAEDLSAHELSALHAEYCRKADEALKHLETRHGKEAARAALKRATARASSPH